MQPGRKGPAGSPSGPALRVPAASQRPCRRPRPGPRSSAHPGVGTTTQCPLTFCEDEQIRGPPSPRRTLPGLGSKAARVPPAPDGARAAPVDGEGGFPLCLQVDDQRVVDSLICSPARSLPVIHPAPHSHLRPLTTHCLPDSHSIPGTSWAPSSYPFRSPTSYSSYHCDEHSAQISTSLVWVPPGGTSPRTWPRPPTSCPELSFLRDVGSHEDPRGTHICATNRGGSIRPSGQWDMEATR